MKNYQDFYQAYGEYNVLFNQLNLESPSVAYSWRKTKKIIEDEAAQIINKLARDNKIKIADVGCGNGAMLIRLASRLKDRTNIELIGFDISKPFVRFANKAAEYKNLRGIAFIEADLENDDFGQGKFDMIICLEVIEHLKDPINFLKKAYGALKDGGWLLLSTPNSNNWIKYPLWWLKGMVRKENDKPAALLTEKERTHKAAEEEQHISVFSHQSLKKSLIELGFEITKTPRGSLVFGGEFFDGKPILMAVTIVADRILDFFGWSEVGWNNIFVCQKTRQDDHR